MAPLPLSSKAAYNIHGWPLMPTFHAPARPPRSALADFFEGAHDVWRGAGFLLARPALWIWALIPFVLNIIFFTLLAWGTWHFAGSWIHAHFFSGHGLWLNILGWVLGVLFWIGFGLLVFFLFVPLASLVASPFNDVLSEKVERLYAGERIEQGFSLGRLVRSIATGLHSTLRLALVSTVLLVAALPLGLLPPPLGPALWSAASAAITIRFIALQFTAYSMDRRIYTYRQRRDFLRRNRARTIGLGTMAFAVMLVPGLNALFIPVSAVAGTLLFCDARRE